MDEFFWEHVEISKTLSPQERILGTLDMINLTRSLMVAGIRNQFPGADEAEVRWQLRRRFQISRELDLIP